MKYIIYATYHTINTERHSADGMIMMNNDDNNNYIRILWQWWSKFIKFWRQTTVPNNDNSHKSHNHSDNNNQLCEVRNIVWHGINVIIAYARFHTFERSHCCYSRKTKRIRQRHPCDTEFIHSHVFIRSNFDPSAYSSNDLLLVTQHFVTHTCRSQPSPGQIAPATLF